MFHGNVASHISWFVRWPAMINVSLCWLFIILANENKFQCNLNQTTTIFIQENGFENIICKMLVILLV